MLAYKRIRSRGFFLVLFVWFASAHGQRTPDPNTGNTYLRRQGIMDGNLVRTIFINWGEVAHWPDQPSGEWPKGSGHSYVDGVALVVQARTVDNNGNIIYPMETQYREFVDRGPKDELWGWGPVPGYFAPRQDEPAMSDDPLTWPTRWPDKPDWYDPETGLPVWNGWFGRGVFNADLETYFVFDDDPDEEWDFYPDPTDTLRRGLGLEVAARLFQWSQVLAEDCIFSIYFITNEGQTDYDSTFYCFYIDWGVGGTDDSSDDVGDYNSLLDIAYAYDFDGFGTPGRWSPVGVSGFAFLESPGISDDMKDNDDDGIVDESRTSGPGVWLDTYPYGLSDPDAFNDFHDNTREIRPHWSGDEDIDWRGYEDINENNQWDFDEPLHDDLGADGLGPLMIGYPGPDEGEGDGLPTAGEANFDYLDKDESDQIGLTGFAIFPVHNYELHNEKQNWAVFRAALPPREGLGVTANLGMFFSSGPFALSAGQTENYSMALIFSEDEVDLARTKRTVQQIYNADYRFARPPEKSQLTAIPGDERVTLVWDSKAEQSFDPFLQEFDFEGYRIYRATDPEFMEARLITDAYGRLTFRKPIAQFDLKNGIEGLHPIDVQGVKFDMGEDSGLRHLYIDTNVQNGQTYYYALVSYDHGYVDTSATGVMEGIPPSECASVIKQDIAGNIETDLNTAVVTPNPPAAGFVSPGLVDGIYHDGPATGSVDVQFVLGDSMLNGRTYAVVFRNPARLNDSPLVYYSIYDVTDGDSVLLVGELPVLEEAQSPLFDGLVVEIWNDSEVEVDYNETGWVEGNSNFAVFIEFDPRYTSESQPIFNINMSYPADFELRFHDDIADTSDAALGFPAVPVKFSLWNLTENKPAKFFFRDFVVDETLTPDSRESVVIFFDNPDNAIGVSTTWRIMIEADSLQSEIIPPSAGDVYRITTRKPFRTGESVTFTVSGPMYDQNTAVSDLERIIVVPNPYVAAASWEPRNPYRFGRGERRIWFMNLPADCTIRIYTVRGYLVDTIEHHGTMVDGAESWDLVSKDGMDIAYGIYVYHVEAPGIGEKIGKFAVIK